MPFRINVRGNDLVVRQGDFVDFEIFINGATKNMLNDKSLSENRLKQDGKGNFPYKLSHTSEFDFPNPSNIHGEASQVVYRLDDTKEDAMLSGDIETHLAVDSVTDDSIIKKEDGGRIQFIDKQGMEVEYGDITLEETRYTNYSDEVIARETEHTNYAEQEEIPSWYDGAPIHYRLKIPEDASSGKHTVEFVLTYINPDTGEAEIASETVVIQVLTWTEANSEKLRLSGLAASAVASFLTAVSFFSPLLSTIMAATIFLFIALLTN